MHLAIAVSDRRQILLCLKPHRTNRPSHETRIDRYRSFVKAHDWTKGSQGLKSLLETGESIAATRKWQEVR
jgi:hypothetical protein